MHTPGLDSGIRLLWQMTSRKRNQQALQLSARTWSYGQAGMGIGSALKMPALTGVPALCFPLDLLLMMICYYY